MDDYDIAQFYKEMGHSLESLQQAAYDDGAYNLSMRLAQVASRFRELYVEYFDIHTKK